MEWPADLLLIFEEEEFVNVHPTSPRGNADDRLKEAFRNINIWYREKKQEPQFDGVREERSLAMQLKGIRETDWKRETLRRLDEFNLLDEAK